MARTTELLTISLNLNAGDSAKQIARELEAAAKAGNAAAARELEKLRAAEAGAEKRAQQASAKRMEELVERRRRLAVESIKDEAKRRHAMIEAEYQAERRRIKMLLEERLKAGEVTERQMKRQMQQFEVALRASRDRRQADVPGQAVMGNKGRLVDALGLGAIATPAGAATVALGALSAAFVQAARVGAAFDAQMSGVAAKSGATQEDLAKMREQAISLGGATQFSATEVAEAMTNLAAAGMTTEQVMAAVPGVLAMAASEGMNLGDAAQIASDTLTQFNLAADQAGRVSDVLAAAASGSSADIGQMGNSLKYAAPAAAALGLSVEQTSAALMALAQAGIRGEQAGTTLRGGLLALVDPSKAAQAAMDRVGLKVTDNAGKFKPFAQIVGELAERTAKMTDAQRAQTVAQIVGTEASSGFLALLRGGSKVLLDYQAQLEHSTGAAAEMARVQNDNIKGDLEQLGGAWETVMLRMNDSTSDLQRGVVQSVTGILEGLGDLMGQAETAQQTFARLNEEMADLDKGGDLAKKYDELTAKLATLEEGTAEHERTQAELNGTTAELGRLFPGVVTAYDEMGRASAINVSKLRDEIGALRERNQLLREVAVGDAAAQLRQAQARAEAARRAGMDVQGTAAGRATVANRQSLAAQFGGAGGLGVGAYGAALSGTSRAPAPAQVAAEAAGIGREMRASTENLTAAQDGMAFAIRQTIPGVESVQEGTAGYARALRETVRLIRERTPDMPNLEQVARDVLKGAMEMRAPAQPAAPPAPQGTGTGTTETSGRTRSNKSAQRAAEAEARRALEAAERLREQAAARAAEQVSDEYDRQVDVLKARYARERAEIEETAQAALKPFATRRALTEAEQARRAQILTDQATATDALAAIERREIAAVEQARSRAAEARREADFREREEAAGRFEERLRMAGMTEAGILAMRRLRLQTEIAAETAGTERHKALLKQKAQLQLDIEREAHERRQRYAQMDRDASAATRQAELDALADTHALALVNIDDERERERQAIRFRQEEREAAAHAAYTAEMERIRDTVKDAGEAQRAAAAAEVALDRSVEDAKRAAARETAEVQRRLDEQRRDQIRRYAEQAFDVVVQASQRERRYTDAQVARERRGFDQQEKDLRESYRRRQLTTTEFNDRMAELAERRAVFEKDAAADSASFVTNVLLGMVQLAKQVALEIIRTELAKAATAALTPLFGGPGGIVAALGGPLGFAAVGAATIAAVMGLEALLTKGFAVGGYTGRGRRYEVAGVAHRGEYVMEAPIVAGQEAEWAEIRRLAQSGVPARAFLDAAQVRAALRPALPVAGRTAAVNAFDDRRLVAATHATNARLDRLSRAVDALANRPVTYVVGDADARRQRYAAAREDRRVDPSRRL